MANYFDLGDAFKLMPAYDAGGVKPGDILVKIISDAFSTTGTTKAINISPINQVLWGHAVPLETYSPATDAAMTEYKLFVGPDVTEDTNSHQKTCLVTRSSQGAISGLKFKALIMGMAYTASG